MKALAGDAEPGHDTIAHFISSPAEAVKVLGAQVLLQCYARGLLGGELFTIDGRKLPSNAAKEWSGTIEELRKKKSDPETLIGKIRAEHTQLDQDAAGEQDLSGAAFSYGYDKAYQDKHVEQIEKKIKYLDPLSGKGRGGGRGRWGSGAIEHNGP